MADRTRNERQAKWRERQRVGGKKPLTVWLDESTFEHLKATSKAREQDTGEIIKQGLTAISEIAKLKAKKLKKVPSPTSQLTKQEQSPIKARILKMRADGLSFQAIADVLNSEEITTPSQKGLWSRKIVSRVSK